MSDKKKHHSHHSHHGHHRHPHPRPHQRPRPKPRLGIQSLRIWLPLFIIVVGIIAFTENGDPSKFYQSVPDFAKYALYIFTLWVSVLIGYRIFDKCDINPRSERSLFAMQLLSAGLGAIGIVLIIYSYLWSFVGLFFGASLFRDIISLFGVFLGFALLVVSAFLLFKFERRSGIIVFHH
ncbi:MAG: hypothetical protein ABSD92_11815 [Candidatus Bathyarchaeia archaeon]